MSVTGTGGGSAPDGDDAELRLLLEEGLREREGSGGPRIATLRRRPSEYRTSFAIDELEVVFEDGSTLELLFKDLRPSSLLATASRTRPAFLYDPAREVEVYRRLLARHVPGTATCFAAVADGARGRYWLALERVPGVELYQVGDPDVWTEVARWLAGLHARFAARPDLHELARQARLLRHDGAFYSAWMERARTLTSARAAAATPRERTAWAHLVRHYHRVVERLVSLPPTVLHGEFYPSNVLVHRGPGGLRVCPVDWETAALGPGLVDLAAHVSGDWDPTERTAVAVAYRAALLEGEPGPAGQGCDSLDGFLRAMDCCRLHVAVQWSGWSRGWTPPAEHAHDWFGEALRLAEQLDL